MTNILQKSLLVAFGVFIVVSFLWFITPFTYSFIDFSNNEGSEINTFTTFIGEINSAIETIINEPDISVIERIDYPNNINLTLSKNMIKFVYFYDSQIKTQFYQYSIYFINRTFENITPGPYILKVAFYFNLVNISIL